MHEVADCGALAVDHQLRHLALLDGQELGDESGGVAVRVSRQDTLKTRKLMAPIAPIAARSAAAWSAASLLVPHGLLGATAVLSLTAASACASEGITPV